MSSCGQCIYFNSEDYTVGSSSGHCYRFPPLDGNGHRPTVSGYTTACGEFRDKNKSEKGKCPVCKRLVNLDEIRLVREE